MLGYNFLNFGRQVTEMFLARMQNIYQLLWITIKLCTCFFNKVHIFFP